MQIYGRGCRRTIRRTQPISGAIWYNTTGQRSVGLLSWCWESVRPSIRKLFHSWHYLFLWNQISHEYFLSEPVGITDSSKNFNDWIPWTPRNFWARIICLIYMHIHVMKSFKIISETAHSISTKFRNFECVIFYRMPSINCDQQKHMYRFCGRHFMACE